MELEKMFKIGLISYNHSIPIGALRKLVSKGEWGYCKKTDSIPTHLMDDVVGMFKDETKELGESYRIVEAILAKLREKRDFYKCLSTLSGKLPDEKDAALMLLEEMEWEIQNMSHEETV
jgi:hypothetical protein